MNKEEKIDCRPLTEKEVKLGDVVYSIIKCGTYRDGFEMQIVKYTVAYKGAKAFVPDDFQTLHDRYQVVPYDNCYSTLEEAQQAVKNKFPKNKDVTFSIVAKNWCWNVDVN